MYLHIYYSFPFKKRTYFHHIYCSSRLMLLRHCCGSHPVQISVRIKVPFWKTLCQLNSCPHRINNPLQKEQQPNKHHVLVLGVGCISTEIRAQVTGEPWQRYNWNQVSALYTEDLCTIKETKQKRKSTCNKVKYKNCTKIQKLQRIRRIGSETKKNYKY